MRHLGALMATAACLLVVHFAAGSPLKFHSGSLPCERLPINVRPTKYDLHLKFPSLDSDAYEGQVDIAVRYQASGETMLDAWGLRGSPCAQDYEDNVIVMHADKNLEINSLRVTSQPFLQIISGREQKQREIVEVVRDEAKQMMAIRVKRGIYASKQGTAGKISISFRGRMRNDKRGVYVSTYNDGEQVYKSIVSQFQPTDARTVFPCFDEPRFRVPFSVRVSHPKGLTAYGNAEVQQVDQEGTLASTLFKTTPDMPVHMVAFTVGQFDEPLEATSMRRGKGRKVRVITAPGKRQSGRFALDVAERALEWSEHYFDYEFPLEKLDVIADADHDKDNTESWGLVFVRDTLLWIDDETLPETRITTAVNVAHVVVHQWFANLISIKWWSDIWITEGVAAQFAFKVVQDLYNSYESEFFSRFPPLSQADISGALHPLAPPSKELQTSKQIYSIITAYWYIIAGSYAQMCEDTIGSSNYQKALRTLVKDHAYGTIDFQDYWIAMISAAPKQVWPKDGGSLLMTKIYEDKNDLPSIYCHIDSRKEDYEYAVFKELRRNILGYKAEIPDSQQVQVSVGPVGDLGFHAWKAHMKAPSATEIYLRDKFESDDFKSLKSIDLDYRNMTLVYLTTQYTDHIYNCFKEAIKVRYIPALDRQRLLKEAIALARRRQLAKGLFNDLLDSFADEDNPAVVWTILEAQQVYSEAWGEPATPMASDAAIARIFENYAFEATGREKLILQHARSVVLKALIQQGNQAALAGALEAFDRDGPKLALFLREPVYTAVVLSASERVNKLLDHLAETKSYEEKIRLVKALTLSKDKEVLQRVKLWLASSGLKPETTKPFLDAIEAALSQ